MTAEHSLAGSGLLLEFIVTILIKISFQDRGERF